MKKGNSSGAFRYFLRNFFLLLSGLLAVHVAAAVLYGLHGGDDPLWRIPHPGRLLFLLALSLLLAGGWSLYLRRFIPSKKNASNTEER